MQRGNTQTSIIARKIMENLAFYINTPEPTPFL